MVIEEALLTEIAQAEMIVQNYKEVEHCKLRAYETLVYYQKGR
jgi:oligo-1,6-glucosidase